MEATQLEEILSVLSPPRRRQLGRALEGLDGGLGGRGGDLNRTFESTSAAVSAGRRWTLAADRARLGRLVDSFGRVTRALGKPQ